MQQKLSNIVRRGRVIAGGAVLVVLASCGGSDNGGDNNTPVAVTPPTSTTSIPSTASSSVTGFIAFLKTLTPTMQDTAQPIDTTGFVAPMDDTAVPDPSI